MMCQQSFNNNKHKTLPAIVTGVTGLLRAKSQPRNIVYANHSNAFSDPVTGLRVKTRARTGKIFFNPLSPFIFIILYLKKLPREVKTPVTPVTLVTTIDLYKYFTELTRNTPVTNHPIPVTAL